MKPKELMAFWRVSTLVLIFVSGPYLAAAQPSSSAVPTPLLTNVKNDQILAGPVRVPLSRSTPTDIGVTLTRGLKYCIYLEGIGGIRYGEKGCDPLFRYDERGVPKGYVLPSDSLKLFNPDSSIYGIAKKAGPVRYNPAHTYSVVIEGTGGPLKAQFVERELRSYSDNTGEFTITVYPEPPPIQAIDPMTGKPVPFPGSEQPKPDADTAP